MKVAPRPVLPGLRVHDGIVVTALRSNGFVLLTVLVVVMLASMLSVSLMFSLRADVTAQVAGEQQEQAWSAAMSGVSRAIAVAQSSMRGVPLTAENPGAFQHQFVAPDGDDRWYFTVYSASDSIGAEVRFGLTDEAGKFPLKYTDPAWLAILPGLDETLARALAPAGSAYTAASTTNPGTASPLPPTGSPTNSPAEPALETGAVVPSSTNRPATLASSSTPDYPDTLEEVFVRAGVGLQLLYGEDANHNLRLDPNEDDGDTESPSDDRNGLLDPGLQQFLSTVSYDPNVDSEGRPRINLNDPKADLSALGLPAATTDYLAALRRAGRNLAHPVELLDAETSLPDAAGKVAPLKSAIGRDQLPAILDRCTTTDSPRLEGLININSAPRAVLAAIPALGETGADAIVAARPGLGADERRTPAWLLQRGLVTADQFKQLAPHFTTRSFQFSFHSLGYSVPSGRYRVLDAVIDVAPRPARILALRDLTRLGFPMPIELLQNAGP